MQISYRTGLGLYVATDVADTAQMLRHGWQHRRLGWVTSRIDRVAPFVEHCQGDAHTRVHGYVEKRRADIAASVAPTATLHIPVGAGALAEGKDFRGYQRAGVAFMHSRRNSYNTDSRRLGKTVQAIGVANLVPADEWQGALIISPAGVKINWCNEWRKWSVHPQDIEWCEGKANPKTHNLVCNYDILSSHIDYINSRPWSIVAFDEAGRYLRNERTQRTQLALGGGAYDPIRAQRNRLFLDGTPIYTRTANLWPIVKACDPNGLGSSWWKFSHRYCNPVHNGFAMEFLGSSNGEELQHKMRSTFMIGRAKSDVTEELPPNRQTIVLPKTGLAQLVRRERNLVQTRLVELENMLQATRTPELADEVVRKFGHLDGGDNADGTARAGADLYDGFEPVASIRRELAVAKIPMVVAFIEELLETEPKVVIFAHHRDVVKGLKERFPNAACIIGGMSATKRKREEDRFRDDPKCTEFIGNITAAGVGIELAAADVVVFAELSWMPAEMDQAEDRVWLIEKTVPIQIFRLVIEDSLESQMAELLVLRQDGIERATVAKRMSAAGLVN